MAPFIPSLEAVVVALLRSIHPAAKQLSGALNTVQHHDLHHRFPTRHFSLYFTHWDRWCGTEHPAYCEQVGTCPYSEALPVMVSHTGHTGPAMLRNKHNLWQSGDHSQCCWSSQHTLLAERAFTSSALEQVWPLQCKACMITADIC